MSDKKVSIIYTLKDKASKGIKGLIGSVKNLKNNLFSLNTFIAGLSFGLISRSILKATKFFGIQEEAVKSLNTALKNNDSYTKEISKDLQKYASELQKTTIYGDENLIQAQALFAQFGLNANAIKKLTKASTDLATAKGITLKQAADLLSKSVGSTTNALSRYGIIIEGLPNSTQRVDSAVRSLSGLFGGQATAQAKTFNGSIQQMKNSVGDLIEILGEQLSPVILNVSESIKFFVEYLQKYDFNKVNIFLKEISSNLNVIYKSIKFITTELYKSINGILNLKKTFNDTVYILNKNLKNIFNINTENKLKKQQQAIFDRLKNLKEKYNNNSIKSEKKYIDKINKIYNSLEENSKKISQNKKTFSKDIFDQETKEKNNIISDTGSGSQLDVDFDKTKEHHKKLLTEQKTFLQNQIYNENINIKQKKKIEQDLSNYRLKLLEQNYQNHLTHADALVDLTDNVTSFEIKSARDVARASVEILKKTLATQVDSIIKTGIAKALSQGNFPLVGAILAAGVAAKTSINAMKFNKGGIVPGNKFYGDKVIGKLNSGEMILNRGQQLRLFNLINTSVLAKKNNLNFYKDKEDEDIDLKDQKTHKEIVILTDDGRELAKGISYIQSEMKRNGELI